MAHLRVALDQAGGTNKTLVIAGDGSFCNRTVLATIPERSTLIARTRKDAKLCFAAAPGGRRNCGIPFPFPGSLFWPWPLTAPLCSPPSRSSEPLVGRHMPNSPGGAAMPAALPALISSRYYAGKPPIAPDIIAGLGIHHSPAQLVAAAAA
jgi:hypothetical protein